MSEKKPSFLGVESPVSLDSIKKLQRKRQFRASQRKSRGDKRSSNDEAEDLCIIVAWALGEITEGQAVRSLRKDRVYCRILKNVASDIGAAIARADGEKSQIKYLSKMPKRKLVELAAHMANRINLKPTTQTTQ